MTKRNYDPIQKERIGTVAERVRELMGDDSLRKFSLHVGMSEGAIRKILQGSTPSLESAYKIASACGVSIDWLATGKAIASVKADASKEQEMPSQSISLESFNEDFCLIPDYHIKVSKNPDSSAVDEAPKRWLAFRKKYLEHEGLTPERCAVVFVKGDSMADTILDNDSLLVDTSSTTPIDGQIYVVKMGDELYAKRVQKSFDGSIILISDNKDYAPISVPVDKLPELCIVGKVVQRSTDL